MARNSTLMQLLTVERSHGRARLERTRSQIIKELQKVGAAWVVGGLLDRSKIIECPFPEEIPDNLWQRSVGRGRLLARSLIEVIGDRNGKRFHMRDG